MKLSKEKIQSYVTNPFICPSCGSDEIIAGDFCLESNSLPIHCHSCKSKWNEVYLLNSIEMHESCN